MAVTDLHTKHERLFEDNRFVYPVISRRSRGLSIGVNLNPDKVCNFDCIYCQVDRTRASETRFVQLDAVLGELTTMLQMVQSGRLYRHPRFRHVPESLRRLNDIAFSGDGEPTTYRNFDEIIAACAEVKRRHRLQLVKLVLITNASMFHRPHVQRGLEILNANEGEIWAKLDAGTENYFQQVGRTRVKFHRILENIASAAVRWPIVIQSLFLKIDGCGPSDAELAAYCNRLQTILGNGGQIRCVQVHTIARPPAASYVTPLNDTEVDRLADQVRIGTGLDVEAFYGSNP